MAHPLRYVHNVRLALRYMPRAKEFSKVMWLQAQPQSLHQWIENVPPEIVCRMIGSIGCLIYVRIALWFGDDAQ